MKINKTNIKNRVKSPHIWFDARNLTRGIASSPLIIVVNLTFSMFIKSTFTNLPES